MINVWSPTGRPDGPTINVWPPTSWPPTGVRPGTRHKLIVGPARVPKLQPNLTTPLRVVVLCWIPSHPLYHTSG